MRLCRIIIFVVVVVISALGFACVASQPDGDRAANLLPDSLIGQIRTDGTGMPIVVFNPLSWTRTDAVEVESPFPGEDPNVSITDERGRVCPARCLGDRLYFTARDVPAIGYKVFWANKAPKPVPTSVKCSAELLDNQFFRVRIDKYSGVITSIYDKLNSRQLMPTGGLGALLRVVSGNGAAVRDLKGDSTAVMMDSGPARAMVILDHGYEKTPFVQEVSLYDGVPRIDIRLTSDWRQSSGVTDGSSLRVAFATDVRNPKATIGGIEPAQGGQRFPALRWVDCSARGYGVSLLVDRASDVSVDKGVLTATIMKPSAKPDSDSGESMREVHYSLFAHRGDWRAGGVFRRAYELTEPLVARLSSKHAGALPHSLSLVSVSDTDVVAIALEQKPTDNSLTLRFYEIGGKGRNAAALVHSSFNDVFETDSNGGRIGAKGVIEGGKFSVKLAAYDARTFLFTSAGQVIPISAEN